ncbi:hypothetical protein D9758_006292 [Tetrapyrgos nigripes]|uniref:Uncharacterized protein n=1 Tax=Tetrapyrgos nigripes TaxID=182062 RepID=A0A8H5G067_9AGAR|nr:hypothetical protein D9758_006292 [Tetrapyrgos nigripes]
MHSELDESTSFAGWGTSARVSYTTLWSTSTAPDTYPQAILEHYPHASPETPPLTPSSSSHSDSDAPPSFHDSQPLDIDFDWSCLDGLDEKLIYDPMESFGDVCWAAAVEDYTDRSATPTQSHPGLKGHTRRYSDFSVGSTTYYGTDEDEDWQLARQKGLISGTSTPRAWHIVASMNDYSNSLIHFRPSRLALDLSIGHKRGKWYLVFARAYKAADSREVTRLDQPFRISYDQDTDSPVFWFDPTAFTGWEKEGQPLLDYLLELGPHQPAVLKVVTPARENSERKGRGSLVEVLVSEGRLAHWCERCREWETMTLAEESRWKISSRSRRLPTYLCPECQGKDWFGPKLFRALRNTFC